MVRNKRKYFSFTIIILGLLLYFFAGPAIRSLGEERINIAFVIAEDEYDAHLTLPDFAEEYLDDEDITYTVIQSDETDISGMERIGDADLVILYVRRRHPTESQLGWLRDHLENGKPLIALRTSSHAFETWTEFDNDVLGGNYTGHHGNYPPDDPSTYVEVASEANNHPIVKDLPTEPFVVSSWLYKVRPLANDAEVLMTGWVEGDGESEPVAWIRSYNGAPIFYTSLGHPDDFENTAFLQLLNNAIHWSLGTDNQ